LTLVSNRGDATAPPTDAVVNRLAESHDAKPFALDRAKPLVPASFPNQPLSTFGQIPPTIPNFQHLLRAYKISVKYNIIKKKVQIVIQGHKGSFDNQDNVLLTQITSIAALNGFPTSQISNLLLAVADRQLYNPVADWITSVPWDGVDRLPAFYATLVENEDFPKSLKETLMYRWLLSPVAAALKPFGFRCRGALTLQGPQGIGKTTWIESLVPDEILCAQVVLLNHHLDGSNKDSITTAVSHWIVEIGELDGSFKKDIARLKGFLTADADKVRRPYGRQDSEYPRRTVFCATVNDANFLVDPTGNSRWWTIPVSKITYKHGIDMQQLFAQLAVDYENGAQWWLTPDEERELELHNKAHQVLSPIRERLLDAIDQEAVQGITHPAMTATELLQTIGLNFPTMSQCKECAGVLRELYGEPKKIKGRMVWRVPMKRRQPATLPEQDDPELY
jgi:putative DNA primase/helicase